MKTFLLKLSTEKNQEKHLLYLNKKVIRLGKVVPPFSNKKTTSPKTIGSCLTYFDHKGVFIIIGHSWEGGVLQSKSIRNPKFIARKLHQNGFRVKDLKHAFSEGMKEITG